MYICVPARPRSACKYRPLSAPLMTLPFCPHFFPDSHRRYWEQEKVWLSSKPLASLGWRWWQNPEGHLSGWCWDHRWDWGRVWLSSHFLHAGGIFVFGGWMGAATDGWRTVDLLLLKYCFTRIIDVWEEMKEMPPTRHKLPKAKIKSWHEPEWDLLSSGHFSGC